MRIKYKKIIHFFKEIVKKMFEKLKTNSLLLVEMLFRFSDFKLKNQILNNYVELE